MAGTSVHHCTAQGTVPACTPACATTHHYAPLRTTAHCSARYTTPDPSLHGPWSLADSSFAHVAGASRGVGGSSGPSFLPLPNVDTFGAGGGGSGAAGAGDAGGAGGAGGGGGGAAAAGAGPTHLISDGSNAVFQYGTWNASSQELVLNDAAFPLDHGDFKWAAAGE